MVECRHHFNKVILEKLLELNEKYPDYRLIQLLWATGIIHTDHQGNIIDDFYEESKSTWNRIKELHIFKKNESN